MARIPQITDVNSDAQGKGLQTTLIYDREMLARLGLTVAGVNSILYDSFGQRQVSTLYKSLNQYHVIMELANQFEQGPSDLKGVYFIGPNGSEIPLSAVAKYGPTNTPLVVNHQGQFVASTISFNLPEGVSLSQAGAAIDAAMRQIGVPSTVRGSFQGTAKAFQDAMGAMPLLILAAIVAVYIVLGILYESLVHPLTILSTLPSAGVGALLALKVFDMEFTIIALIGVLLLIGIVKKNAILMIDFAIEAERRDNLHPKEAIFQAAVLRFRPIMMTTMAALLGALPLAIGFGDGSELRQPLGISIVGGLLVSQVLTLYTTPIVYYYFDAMTTRVKRWVRRRRGKSVPAGAAPARSSA
jgi:multidrug efflux pump